MKHKDKKESVSEIEEKLLAMPVNENSEGIALNERLSEVEMKHEAKEVQLVPEKEEAPIADMEYDVRGSLDYWLQYKGTSFQSRYNLNNQVQLVGMMVVRDTFKSVIKANEARGKGEPGKLSSMEMQHLRNAVTAMDKYIPELAGYVLDQHKIELKKEGVVKKIGLTDVNGNPLK